MPANYERHAARLSVTNVLQVLCPKLNGRSGWMGTSWTVPFRAKCAVASAVCLLPAISATSLWAPLQWLPLVWYDVCLAVIFPSDRDLSSEERFSTKVAMLEADYLAAATPVLLYSILPIMSESFDLEDPFNEDPFKNLNCYLDVYFYVSAVMWLQALISTMCNMMKGFDSSHTAFSLGKATCTIVLIALIASPFSCCNAMCEEAEVSRNGPRLVLLILSLCPFIDFMNDARLQVSLMLEPATTLDEMVAFGPERAAWQARGSWLRLLKLSWNDRSVLPQLIRPMCFLFCAAIARTPLSSNWIAAIARTPWSADWIDVLIIMFAMFLVATEGFKCLSLRTSLHG